MEKSEPALAPEWLKGTGNISGGGNTSHHPASSLSHSDDHASILSLRNRSSFIFGGDFDSPRLSERNSSSDPFRRSISSNGSSFHGKDSSLFPRSYSSFSRSHRDKDCDKDFLDYDRERSILEDYKIRDYSDPMCISHSSLSSRIEKDTLRRSHSMISGKRSEGWSKKVTIVLNSSKTNSHNINNGVNVGGTTVINIHKTTIDRDFPSLGAEERQGIPEIGRVSSPGLGSAAQSFPMGTSAVLTDCWTSALVEPPPTIGSTNIALTFAQQSSTMCSTIPAPSSTIARNMAETLTLAPPRACIAPQVDNEASIGEDSFVWLASLVPLLGDIVNGRFTYETLTAPTANRIHFPAYDKYLKEVDKYIKYLQKQPMPTGVELAYDEFILHMEGTARTQRVVRHIGGSSWPGRLVLTNYALYFEASGVVSYEDALKVDLSKNVDHNVKRSSTGPLGAPLFDKAIVYESPELSESLVLEFPEMTSSTRREHWVTLIKEVILLHQFLFRFNIDSPLQAWEMHARTVLGIVRLHAAREMLRMSPPAPTNFLIFSLFDELPNGDFCFSWL